MSKLIEDYLIKALGDAVVSDPNIQGGMLVIRGTRITIKELVGLFQDLLILLKKKRNQR